MKRNTRQWQANSAQLCFSSNFASSEFIADDEFVVVVVLGSSSFVRLHCFALREFKSNFGTKLQFQIRFAQRLSFAFVRFRFALKPSLGQFCVTRKGRPVGRKGAPGARNSSRLRHLRPAARGFRPRAPAECGSEHVQTC